MKGRGPSVEDVLHLHERLVTRFGGVAGVRNRDALEGILEGAWQTYAGEELYPDAVSKAIHLCEQTIRQPPFVDGNKRVALALLGAQLHLSGFTLEVEADDLFLAVTSLVTREWSREEFESFVRAHLREP